MSLSYARLPCKPFSPSLRTQDLQFLNSAVVHLVEPQGLRIYDLHSVSIVE